MLPEETGVSPVEPSTLQPVQEQMAEPAVVPPPPPAREPFWGYLDLALVIGLLVAALVLIIVAVGVIVFAYPKLRDDPTPLLVPTNIALYLCLLACFKVVLGTRYERPVFPSLGWRPTSRKAMAIAAAVAVPLVFVVNGIAMLLKTPKIATPFDNMAQSPVSLALLGVMAVAIAPVFEELFFRGFLQPLLSRTFGVASGILITSILFGSLHAFEYSFVWQYVVAVSLVGIALGITRAITNSIIPGVVMHGCYNCAFVIALAVTKHS